MVQNLLRVRLLSSGAERPRPRSRQRQASTMSCLPFPGPMSRTRSAACRRGTAEYSIDATNPFIEYNPKLVLADLGGKGASEVVAALAPGARVVKAFNSIVAAHFNEGPMKSGGRRVIFVSGDHPEPADFVKSVIESFGFVAVYLGGLATGGRMQQAGGPLAGRDLVDFGRL